MDCLSDVTILHLDFLKSAGGSFLLSSLVDTHLITVLVKCFDF